MTARRISMAALGVLSVVAFAILSVLGCGNDVQTQATTVHKDPIKPPGGMVGATPRYGGYYKDHAEGIIYVYVTGDPATAPIEEIREAYIREYGADRLLPNGFRVLHADYSMRDLIIYRDLLSPVLANKISEAVSLDLAEQSNRVVVEVRNEEGRQKVLAFIRAFEIPEGAVRIDITNPPHLN